MAQSKSKSSKSKSSKKSTTPATSKKVKRTTAAVDLTPTPAPIFTSSAELIAAAPAVVLPEPVAAPARTVTRPEFMELVRKEAYRRATRRNFKNGSPFQDWVNAEAAVSGKLAAEGVRLS